MDFGSLKKQIEDATFDARGDEFSPEKMKPAVHRMNDRKYPGNFPSPGNFAA